MAASAYGIAGPIVASVPESAPRMPRRKRRWRAHQFVLEPESAVTMQPSGRRGLSSWKTFSGLSGSAGSSARSASRSPPPALDFALELLAASRGRPSAPSSGSSASQRVGGVAGQVDLHGVTEAEPCRVDVDLHAARLPGLGQELGKREARADHQQGVASLHQLVARLGAEQADSAGDLGQIVGQGRCPLSAFATPEPSTSAIPRSVAPRPGRPARRLSRRFRRHSKRRGALQLAASWHPPAGCGNRTARCARCGRGGPSCSRSCRSGGTISRHRRSPRGLDRPVDQVWYFLRRHRLLHKVLATSLNSVSKSTSCW